MDERHDPLDDAFNRLQELLLGMQAGDAVEPRDASRRSGLAEPTCRSVLEGLTRAGLMSRSDNDRFVRRGLESVS
jgi:DNA-binding IclR family transcriptional regulator